MIVRSMSFPGLAGMPDPPFEAGFAISGFWCSASRKTGRHAADSARRASLHQDFTGSNWAGRNACAEGRHPT
jgi:hypothetical protein